MSVAPRAMILAAGLSTRLGALGGALPKPLFPVCNVPLIRYALTLLRGHGITEVAINLHHHGELIQAELDDGSDAGVEITWSREPEILGTGGGLKRLSDWLTRGGREPFFVINGKIIIDVDLNALLARHHESGAAATMVLRETPAAADWGAIEVAEDGRVCRILGQGRPGVRTCMFTGVHVIGPALLARLPAGVSDSVRQGYQPALAAGETIAALLYDGYFHEHSTPARYLTGNWNGLDGKMTLRYGAGPQRGVHPTAQVEAAAELRPPYLIGARVRVAAGAIVGPYAVVGAGAHIEPGAVLERTVVWPGARVGNRTSGAIVTLAGPQSVRDEA